MSLRPPLVALGALVLGIVGAPLLPLMPLALLGAMLCLTLAGLLLTRRTRLMVAALLGALCLFGAWHAGLAASPLPDDVSQLRGGPSVWVLGTVGSDVETRRERRTFVLSVRAVYDYQAARAVSGRLRVTVRDARGASRPTRLAYGDEVWLRGRIEAPPGATNPGGFDYAAYLARRGVFATLVARRAADVRPTGRVLGAPLSRAASVLRRTVERATARHLGREDAALLNGLLLGIRSGLPADLEDAFARTGTVHTLSTSGLHLAVLAAFLTFLADAVGAPRRAGSLAVLTAIWVFALAAGAGPAVTRSALMLTVLLVAPLVRRDPDPFNTLAVAAFLLLVASPLALYDAGTQLSFATVAALICWAPAAERLLFPWEPGMGASARARRCVVAALAVGVVAQAGSWPLVAIHFNLFSVVAPLANVPVVPLTGVLLVLGLSAAALAGTPLLGPLLFTLLLAPGLWLLRTLVFLFAALPWAAVSVAPPPTAFVVVYYAVLLGGAPFVNRYVLKKTIFTPGPAPAAPAGGALVGVVGAPRAS